LEDSGFFGGGLVGGRAGRPAFSGREGVGFGEGGQVAGVLLVSIASRCGSSCWIVDSAWGREELIGDEKSGDC